MERLQATSPAVLRELRSEYEARSTEVTAAIEALRVKQDDIRAEEAMRSRRQVLLAEKETVLADFHLGTLSAEAERALLANVDARLEELDSRPQAPNDDVAT
jgi:CRISPR/Cas system CMR subunit Cmr4 (Cas7 group RAMP superfamily)